MKHTQAYSSGEHAPTKTILIVEDDEAIGEMIDLTLQDEAHYYPLIVSTGAQALQFVQNTLPDLLIVDYHLTDMTGLELYDKIHLAHRKKVFPVILMSASLEQFQEEIAQRQMLGLSKPFDLFDFLSAIEQALA
jgi:CheY-like chemotaxis protein